MKKLLALLLTILLLTIAFASCNLDGTAGIFRQISQAKAPLDISYKQLLGDDGTNLYFRTADGVVRVTTAKVKTTVIAGKNKNLIQAASYLKSPENKVLYYTNNTAERAANQIRYVDTTNLSAVPGTITVVPADTTSSLSDLSIKSLYANSMILVSGKNLSGDKVYELLQYNGATFTSVAAFTMPDTNYGIHEVIQQTSKEQILNAQMIVSFVNETGDRDHYLVNPSTSSNIPLKNKDIEIANFLYVSLTNIYVLSTDGELFHLDSTTLSPTWTSLNSSSKIYGPNAFALAVDDGTDYHLITKPSAKSSSLHVFTFPMALPNTAVAAGVDVKSGYAKNLALATIVSSQVKSTAFGPPKTTTLLIATDEDGMFDIEIEHPDANKDISTNGSSSEGEGYTFP